MVIVCEDVITRHLKNGTTKKGYYLNQRLKDNIDFEIKRLMKSWDVVMLIDGEEGVAKSTLGSTIAHYMSQKLGTKFDIDDIIYTPEQFQQWIETQPPYSVCLWDEFVLGGLSSEALTRVQNTLIKQMTVMRKKRLVVILIIPYIFMLRKYFAIARTRCLIHVYSPNNLDRGNFMYYSKPNKRMLLMRGLKYWEYGVWKPDFIGSFTNTMGLFFDMEKYEEKKDKSLELIGETRTDKLNTMWKGRARGLVRILREKGMTWKEIADKLNIHHDTLRASFNLSAKEKEFAKESEVLKESNEENTLSSPKNKLILSKIEGR